MARGERETVNEAGSPIDGMSEKSTKYFELITLN